MNENKKTKCSEYDLELLSSEESFGQYLRRVRMCQGISIRQLAKKIDITPTYLSDIENVNNKPPDKVLLLKIINELQLDSSLKTKSNLFDLAAKERNDIPIDIKDYILSNSSILQIIREAKEKSSSDKEIKSRILKRTGGNDYEKQKS